MGARSSTHVANGYGEDIHALVRMDICYTELEEVGVNYDPLEFNAKRKYNWDYVEKNGYTKIAPGSYLRFYPEGGGFRLNPFDPKGTTYVTIVTADGSVISKCFPVPENHSVIVDASGYMKQTKMGTIWTDTDDKNHRP